MAELRTFMEEMTVDSSQDNYQQNRCDKQFQNMFNRLNICSDYRYSSLFEIELSFHRSTNTGIPLFSGPRKRKPFAIETSKTQINALKSEMKYKIIKRWKAILRKIIPCCEEELSSAQYSLVSKYLHSLNYTPDSLRQTLGFIRTTNDQDQPIWVQKEGYDQIRQVLLSKIQSNLFIKQIFLSKCSWRQKVQLISSLLSLRNMILNPNQNIDIQ